MSQPDWNDEEIDVALNTTPDYLMGDEVVVPSRYFVGNEYMNRTAFAQEQKAWAVAHDEWLRGLQKKPSWMPENWWSKLPAQRRLAERKDQLYDEYQMAYAAEWGRAACRQDLAERKPPFPGPKT